VRRPTRAAGWKPSRFPFPERPLDHFTSLKMKFAAVILCADGTTVLVFYSGVRLGIWPSVSGVWPPRPHCCSCASFASGLTSPLREMAAASEAMARGDYSRRVSDTSRDELGALGRAFNAMASELGETDRVRRDLIANVSHELRTPITALQAVLENLVDGVEPADPDTLRTMLAQVERLGRLVKQLLDLSRLESGGVRSTARLRDRSLLDGAVREARLGAPADVAIEVDVAPTTCPPTAIPSASTRSWPTSSRTRCATRRRRNRHAARPPRSRRRGRRGRRPGAGHPRRGGRPDLRALLRADSARATRDGGPGSGWPSPHWIVGLHGGEIHPERRDPHGCRMVFSLPAAPVVPPAPVPVSGGAR